MLGYFGDSGNHGCGPGSADIARGTECRIRQAFAPVPYQTDNASRLQFLDYQGFATEAPAL